MGLQNSRSILILNDIVQYSILALVVLAPLPFGGIQNWVIYSLEISVFLIGIFWLIQFFISGSDIRFKTSPLGWSFIIFTGLAFFQTIPLPNALINILSPEILSYYRKAAIGISGSVPLSIFPHVTIQENFKVLMYVTIYLITIQQVHKKFISRAIQAVIAISFLEALYGLFALWSEHYRIWGYIQEGGIATGTYINRNHFAALLEMGIPVTLGFFFWKINHISQKCSTLKGFILHVFSERNMPSFLILLAFVVMMVALFLSTSRGGIISILISLGFFCVYVLFSIRGWSRKFILIIFSIIVITYAFWFSKGSWEGVIGRFKSFNSAIEGPGSRVDIWTGSLILLSDFPLFGSGLGTYQNVYREYHVGTPLPDGIFIDHAHNEYLELLCESGMIGFLILLVGATLTCLRVFREHNLLKLGILTGLISISLHNLVEFNLRMPANAIIYIFLFALLNCESNSMSSTFDLRTIVRKRD